MLPDTYKLNKREHESLIKFEDHDCSVNKNTHMGVRIFVVFHVTKLGVLAQANCMCGRKKGLTSPDRFIDDSVYKECPVCKETFAKTDSEMYFGCCTSDCEVVLFSKDGDVILGDFGNKPERPGPKPIEEKPYEPGS